MSDRMTPQEYRLTAQLLTQLQTFVEAHPVPRRRGDAPPQDPSREQALLALQAAVGEVTPFRSYLNLGTADVAALRTLIRSLAESTLDIPPLPPGILYLLESLEASHHPAET